MAPTLTKKEHEAAKARFQKAILSHKAISHFVREHEYVSRSDSLGTPRASGNNNNSNNLHHPIDGAVHSRDQNDGHVENTNIGGDNDHDNNDDDGDAFQDDELDGKCPANYVQRVLSTVDIPKQLHRGIPVQKITSGGKFKNRIITISRDRFAIFITHQKIQKNDSDSDMTVSSERTGTTKQGGLFGMLGRNRPAFDSRAAAAAATGVLSTVARTLPLPVLSKKAGLVLFRNKDQLRDTFVRYIDVSDLCSVAQGFPGTQRTELSRERSRLHGHTSKIDTEKRLLVSITYKGNQTLDVVCQNEQHRQWLVDSLNSMVRAYH